jgi:glycosyltransferase involved in cell wall biosynthesis
MSDTRVIVTFVNDVGPTSMPFNEFVAYRARRLPSERHLVLSWAPVDESRLRGGPIEDTLRRITLHDCRGSFRRLARICRRVFQELRQSGEPVVVHLHQPRSGILVQAVRATLPWKPPVLFTVHNSFDRYTLPNRVLSTFNYLLAGEITYVSRSSEQSYPPRLRAARRGHATAVPNGVDLERVDATLAALPRTEGPPRAGDSFRLVNVGRFVEQKYPRFLIELLARLPRPFSLTLVGDGPLRPSAEALARQLGVEDRVRFTGVIPREEVYRELLEGDLFISGSRWEGLPIAVLEAMALSRPVLLSDIPSHREIAELGGAVPVLPHDLDAWVRALGEIAALPPAARAAQGAANRRLVESALSLERMHQAYTELYQRLGNGAGPR